MKYLKLALKLALKAVLICITLFFCWVIALISLELEKPDFIRSDYFYSGKYIYRFRSLTLDDFKDINYGDKYSEIIKKVGLPNGEWGSGIIRPYWVLNDKTRLVMMFSYSHSGYDELHLIGFADSSERIVFVDEP